MREVIEGIRKEVAQIKDTLSKQQTPTTKKPMTYAEAAKAWRRAGEELKVTGGARQQEVAVPARRQREVIVKPGKETNEQKQRNGGELVE